MKRWNTLSPEHQRILEDSIQLWETALSEEVKASAKDGMKAAQEQGVTISAASPTEQAMFDRYYLRDAEKNAAELSRFGIDGAAAFAAARKSIIAPNQIRCGGPA